MQTATSSGEDLCNNCTVRITKRTPFCGNGRQSIPEIRRHPPRHPDERVIERNQL
jgi:hypothetical protein